MPEIQLGQYAIPVLIMIALQVFFMPFNKPDGTSHLPDWAKGCIAILVGVVFGIAALYYNAVPQTVMSWIDYVLYGAIQGAAAIGVYKIAGYTPGIPIGKGG